MKAKPMAHKGFPNTDLMITPQELHGKLGSVSILDFRPAEDYATGHIPGTQHLDLYGVSVNDTSEAPLNAFLAMYQAQFASRGVTTDRPVVIYDGETGERAARGVWLLTVLGHKDVRILEGGARGWTDAGYKMTTEPSPPSGGGLSGPRNMAELATRFDVHDALKDNSVVIIDTRRETEYLGTEKRARRVGTMPGAVHIFWRDHLDDKGALRPADEIRAMYEAKGVTPDKTVIPYCQGGYRSANTWLVLKSLGYTKVKNYMGSWGEWGNRDDSVIVSAEENK
jgi:thiosulfate/3-mercaptopyruvate sulfurtransferase